MKSNEIVDEIRRLQKLKVKKVGDFHLQKAKHLEVVNEYKFEKPSVPKPVRRNIATLRQSLDP